MLLTCTVHPEPVSAWLKNKEKILLDLEKSCTNPKRKKMRNGGHEDTHKAIFQWFLTKRNKAILFQWCFIKMSQNVPIDRVLLKEKALNFAKQLDHPGFKASDCWLSNWKNKVSSREFCKRINIIFEKNIKVFLEITFCL